MTSLLGDILSADTFEDSKKSKKKKSKKVKKDKDKTRKKAKHCLKDETDYFESNIFTQMPKTKKGKKKKKLSLRLDEGLPLLLTQSKKQKLLKRLKQAKDSSYVSNTQPFPHKPLHQNSPSCHKSSQMKAKTCHKKKVIFKLSPEEILPKTPPNLYTARDNFQTLHCSTSKAPSPTSLLSNNGSQGKPAVEKNCLESQSTTEDINSQDLFITQKCFNGPCIEIPSSASTDDAALTPHQHIKTRSSLEEKLPCTLTAEATTQTENFFTSPWLATSLSFHQQIAASLCTEEPMDLSLSNRSMKNLHQLDSKLVKDQSRPDQKIRITDVTSSDDSDTLSRSKADLFQLKMVQTRLNESFFFKMKGVRGSPKPRSPLMKLSENVDKNLKK